MNLGAHVSIAKSFDLAIDRACALGCDSMQIFPGPPQSWSVPNYSSEQLNRFIEKKGKYGIQNVYIHAIYLLNLGSDDINIWHKSYNSLKQAVELQIKIQADGVIFHPGSYKNTTREKGLSNISRGVNKLLGEYPEAKIVFESSAGAGNTIGKDINDLEKLFINTRHKCRICLDTCHLFASGVDVGSKPALNKFIDIFDSRIGINNIEVIHLNDSIKELGSSRDLHANIGAGEIGLNGITRVVKCDELKSLPFILETPDLKDLAKILNVKNNFPKLSYINVIKDKFNNI